MVWMIVGPKEPIMLSGLAREIIEKLDEQQIVDTQITEVWLFSELKQPLTASRKEDEITISPNHTPTSKNGVCLLPPKSMPARQAIRELEEALRKISSTS